MQDGSKPHSPKAGGADAPTSDSWASKGGSRGSSGGSAPDDPTRVADSSSGFAGAGTHVSQKPNITGYELHDEVHRGGQGVVYRATQLSTKRTVALKVLLEGPYASKMARARFEREVELAASLQHASVVTILDSGISNGLYYFAMEFVEGLRLSDYFERHRPPLEDTLRLFEQICDAVNFAHQRGVIHRDLKPSNILVREDGLPCVLDFGLAKGHREHDPKLTTVAAVSTAGQVIGTLAYMSPEQAAGSADVDLRSDVYSLGVILYEALLNQTPYPIDGALADVLQRIMHNDPRRPRSLRDTSRFGRTIDDELETILLKALEKDPNRRYQTAGELSRDLRHYLEGEPIEAKRASGFYILKKTLYRYRLQAGFAGLILVMLVVFLVVFAVQYRSERRLREEAQQLKTQSDQNAFAAERAAAEADAARERAEEQERRALELAELQRRALILQKVQRGELAQARDDLAEARDSFWDAYGDDPNNAAALWALRQYYLNTGDNGAYQLHFRNYGPTTMSDDGMLAAVCESPDAVTLREVESGRTRFWTAAPDEVRTVNVDSKGRLAAVGRTWARIWLPPQPRPVATVDWIEPVEPVSVHVTGDGKGLLVVDQNTVRRFRTADGALVSEVTLKARPSTEPRFSETLRQLAIASAAGVELITVKRDGTLSSELVWTGDADKPVRDVRFIGYEYLAVLADGLHIKLLGLGAGGVWSPFFKPETEWDFFDLKNSLKTIAFGSRDGRVALYRDGTLEEEWRITRGMLAQLRLTNDGETLVTLDDRGSVTRWVSSSSKLQRHDIHDQPVAHWTSSRDGSTILMVDTDGNIRMYAPDRARAPVDVGLPSLMRVFLAPSPEDVALALDAHGTRAIISYEGKVWLKDLLRQRAREISWRGGRRLDLQKLALSDDGQIIALLGRSLNGERDRLLFLPTERPPRGDAPPRPAAHFPSGSVGTMQFMPDSDVLLVALANGSLLQLRPEPVADTGESDPQPPPRPGAREDGPPAPPEPWMTLDAPAYRIAIDRTGGRIAAACDDGFVRLINATDSAEITRINVGQEVASLAFEAAGEALLLRTADGGITLYDLKEFERIAQWAVPAGDAPPLAALIGESEALVLSCSEGVYEVRHRAADRLIGQNRVYARQRQIARFLENYDYADAWAVADRLLEIDAKLGRDAKEAILDQMLRRSNLDVPSAWVTEVMAGASDHTCLRLGHAAYAGGRFELAHACLTHGRQLSADGVDAYTDWRILECEYVTGASAQIAEGLTDLLKRPDVQTDDLPRVALERLASLALTDQNLEAAAALEQLSSNPRMSGLANTTGMMAADLIGRALIDGSGDIEDNLQLRWLARLGTSWANYRDDLEFFAGEMALRHGEPEKARVHYQRCVELARDRWPVDWARYRLRELSKSES